MTHPATTNQAPDPLARLHRRAAWVAAQRGTANARESFASLWDATYGRGAWDANPWVWVITFKIV